MNDYEILIATIKISCLFAVLFLPWTLLHQSLPCFADPWKLRIIAQLNSQPVLKEPAESLDSRYLDSPGVVLVRPGNFFASGKVTIRQVDSIEEGKQFVNSLLAMAAQKQLLKEQE